MIASDLYLVETPFQLLSAYEAIKRFGVPYRLLVRFTGVGRNDKQLQVLLSELDVEVHAILKVRKNSRLDLLRTILKQGHIGFLSHNRVFVGSHYSRVLMMLAKWIRKRELVLLDDGVATFLVQEELREINKPVSLFTLFDLEPLPGQSVWKHSFEQLREKYKSNVEDIRVFIGQDLFTSESISKEDYVRFLSILANGGMGQPFFYLPHRAEPDDVVEKIKEISGVTVVYPTSGIELFFLKRAKFPRSFYSVCSTAIFSLSALFPEAKFYVLTPERYDSSKFVHWRAIETALKKIPNVVFLDSVSEALSN